MPLDYRKFVCLLFFPLLSSLLFMCLFKKQKFTVLNSDSYQSTQTEVLSYQTTSEPSQLIIDTHSLSFSCLLICYHCIQSHELLLSFSMTLFSVALVTLVIVLSLFFFYRHPVSVYGWPSRFCSVQLHIWHPMAHETVSGSVQVGSQEWCLFDLYTYPACQSNSTDWPIRLHYTWQCGIIVSTFWGK